MGKKTAKGTDQQSLLADAGLRIPGKIHILLGKQKHNPGKGTLLPDPVTEIFPFVPSLETKLEVLSH